MNAPSQNGNTTGENVPRTNFTTTQTRWNEIVTAIKSTAEETLGIKSFNKNNRINDPEIEVLSSYQKNLKNQISTCNSAEDILNLRTQRNKILHTIKKKLLKNRESEIDNRVKEINDMHDHTKMFKAIKLLKRKKLKTLLLLTMMANLFLIQSLYIKLFETILVRTSSKITFQNLNHLLEIQNQ